MNILLKRTASIFISLGLLLSSSFVYVPRAAAAGSIYLSPGSGSVEVNKNITVSIRVNAGSEEVNSVKANLSYPSDKLTLVGVSCAGTPFGIVAECAGGGGAIEVGVGTTGSATGDFLVATITFKGKAAGSASVNFTSGTVAVRKSDNQDILAGNWSGGTYTVTSPPPPPDDGGDDGGGGGGGDSGGGGGSGGGSTTGSGSGGSTGSGSGGSTTTSKEPEKDTTGPKISDIQVTGIDFEKATITWKTNEDATSILEFGISKTLGFIQTNKKLTKSHKISLPSNILKPGMRIYYRISGRDKEGNGTKGKITSFKTRGYTVRVSIVNINNEPIVDTTVKILPGFEEAKTNSEGVVEFKDVPPGENAINVELGGQKFSSEFQVEDTRDASKVQEFDAKFSTEATTEVQGAFGLLPITIIVILSITVVILAWYIRSHHLVRKVTVGGKMDKKDSDKKDKKEDPKDKPKVENKKEEEYEPKVRVVELKEAPSLTSSSSAEKQPESKGEKTKGNDEPKLTVVRANDD